MSKLEDLQPCLRLAGVIPGQNVSVIAVQPHGADTIELTHKTAAGEVGQRVLGRNAEPNLTLASIEARPLDADAAVFKLVSECQRIKLAGLSDPMLARSRRRTSSRCRTSLRAVYGELLPRTPLRLMLADDPGVPARAARDDARDPAHRDRTARDADMQAAAVRGEFTPLQVIGPHLRIAPGSAPGHIDDVGRLER